MRILSLSPCTTELIFALGAGNQLVGRTDACNYPEAARTVPSIGNDLGSIQNAAGIFNPDLIIMGCGDAAIRAAFGPARKSLVIAPNSIEELDEAIADLAQELGRSLEAEVVRHDVRLVLDKIEERSKRYCVSRVYLEQDGDSCNDALAHDVIRICGGLPHDGPKDVEALRAFDPQFIILISSDKEFEERVLARDGWNELSAVKNERVFRIDPSLLRPTPRIADGARTIAKILHGIAVNGES